jgi:hypothetical protein
MDAAVSKKMIKRFDDKVEGQLIVVTGYDVDWGLTPSRIKDLFPSPCPHPLCPNVIWCPMATGGPSTALETGA